MRKKLASLSFAGTLILATVSPAFAATHTSNVSTGPHSTNILKARQKQILRHTESVGGRIANNFTQSSIAGNNHSDGNTVGGNVQAGSATANRTTDDIIGFTTLALSQSNVSNGNVVAENNITGPYSVNVAKSVSKTIVNVSHSCWGSVKNNGIMSANTGNNSSNGNTIGGSVSSGNASANAVLQSDVCDTLITITQ